MNKTKPCRTILADFLQLHVRHITYPITWKLHQAAEFTVTKQASGPLQSWFGWGVCHCSFSTGIMVVVVVCGRT